MKLSKIFTLASFLLLSFLLTACSSDEDVLSRYQKDKNRPEFQTWELTVYSLDNKRVLTVDGFNNKLDCYERGNEELLKERMSHFNCSYACVMYRGDSPGPICDIVCDSRDGCRE